MVHRAYRRLLALLLLTALLAGCVPDSGDSPTLTATPGASMPAFDHIYLLVFENHEEGHVIGSAEAPYINSLAGQYGLALNYYALAHPSQPNYLALFSGSTQGVSDDGHHDLPGSNLADQLEAHGRSWRVYEENVPLGCYKDDSATGGEDGTGTYARKHNPAISFTDISNDPSRCDNISDFSHFDPAAADFELIVPNLCHDMHDCSLATGDSWLHDWLPSHLLNSATWRSSNSLLVITWDEGTTKAGHGGKVATIVISPRTPPGYRSHVRHDHYSVLRTVEESWGLGCLNLSCGANDLSEFFR
ncbi:MAG TPA: alkaline phosphatase family protein [Thermomicrobiaceae bacterium]|nr:alkaline phosphatase family protein [Thermomicrobiaceae bacterium]